MRFTVVFTLCLTFGAQAQDSTLIQALNVIHDHLRGHSSQDNAWRNEQKWALKLSPLHFAVGDIAVYYEQRLGKRCSIEIGAGPTISGLGGQFYNLPSPDVINPLIDPAFPYYQTGSYASDAGGLGALEFRIYPGTNSASMHQFYVAPAVKYKLYNFQVHDDYSGQQNYRGNEQRFNAYLNCGLQLWPVRHFVVDIFLGAGVGYTLVHSASVNTMFENGQYIYSWEPYVSSKPAFLLNTGVKIGFGGPGKLRNTQP